MIPHIIHLVEYISKAAHAFHLSGNPEPACGTRTHVQSTHEGNPGRAAGSMRRAASVAGLSGDTRKPVDTWADYLLKHTLDPR